MICFNRYIAVIICCTFSSLLYTYNLRAQSSIEDSSAVLSYYQKGLSYYPKHLDSLYHNYQLGIDLAREIAYHSGEATILRSRGAVKGLNGDLGGAISDIEEAKIIIINHNLGAEELVNCYINQGMAYDRSVQLDLAIGQYIDGEKLARENNLTAKRTMLLNNLGIAYRRLDRYDDALRIYQEGLTIRRVQKDTAGMATIIMNMSAAKGRLGDTTNSLDYAKEAIELYQSTHQSDELLYAENNYGHLLATFGYYEDAIAVLEKVNDNDLSGLDRHQRMTSLQSLAKAYTEQGDFRKSEEVYLSMQEEVEASDFQDIKRESYLYRAKNNEEIGDKDRAYDYVIKHLTLLNQYNDQQTLEARQEMEAKYLAIEKDLKIELQNAALKQSQRERYFYLIGLLGLLTLVGLLWRLSTIRRKNNLILDDKNKIISKSLSEKELLLREIHHRVKNNLQFISSLLRLQSDHVTDAVALGALQQGHDRVRSMALIHQNLYKEENLTGVHTKDYFTKLITGLFSSNNIHQERIKLELDVIDVNLDVDTIIPIGLITNELITNSLKYAFPDDRTGTISVMLKEENDKLSLDITDDGVGMEGDQEQTLGNSFGYKLIKALTAQLEGELIIDNTSGTSVQLSLGLYNKV